MYSVIKIGRINLEKEEKDYKRIGIRSTRNSIKKSGA